MKLKVDNETSQLETVILGQSKSMGKDPKLEETYDAKSYESVLNQTYPKEKDIIYEMDCFEQVLTKHGVNVLRPYVLENYNQVFARDVAFVIDDKLIISNIISDRAEEQKAYKEIFSEIVSDSIYNLPEQARVEGGDIILYKDIVFCGGYPGANFSSYKTARTNMYGVDYLKELFPNKTFINLPLQKDDKDPRKGILHLDCTFMPIGTDKAVLYKDGFSNEKDYHFLVDLFGKSNIFEVTSEEVYFMNTNVFSISPKIIVSENNFTRLNNFLENDWGFTVETIPYYEVSKMGGLFRCSTLPLRRH